MTPRRVGTGTLQCLLMWRWSRSFWGGTQGQAIGSGTGVVPLNQWLHAVFTSGAAGQSLYLNGRLLASSATIIEDHAGRSSVSVGAGNCTCGGPNYADASSLRAGTNYQLQVSGDLNTWTNYGSAFTSTNSTWRSTNHWDVDNWNQLFFRLQVSP